MKRLNQLVLASLAAGMATVSFAADLANGQQKATAVCAACHGADGNTTVGANPRLAGQHAAYIATQLQLFKTGKRTSGLAATMAPIAQGLSDKDIADVAAYFSTQQAKSGESDPKGNVELGAKIYRGGLADKRIPACMACHGPAGAGIPGGSTAKDGVSAFPRIGGQNMPYFVTQMKAFRDGSRVHPMMNPIATRLSDEEINAVANFLQGLH